MENIKVYYAGLSVTLTSKSESKGQPRLTLVFRLAMFAFFGAVSINMPINIWNTKNMIYDIFIWRDNDNNAL